MLSAKLLEILVCPVCKAQLKTKNKELICYKCKLAYSIDEDIPVMLIDQARRIDDEQE
ncbi:MAG: Trm112 family protein [Burkholderiales bacterium]|jgi:uncharacterized protein YbaR (Trm112 family)|nr:Trm112 family protein [Burkholderiales bacterium]